MAAGAGILLWLNFFLGSVMSTGYNPSALKIDIAEFLVKW
jgi:hypothetical protein